MPTRQEAIDAAAAIYLEEKIRIETERAIAEAEARAAEQDDE
ncbi:hypothetical protein [Microbacterium arborescens]|nr:hypothetical protein [Microbacterium arborescens]MDQ1217994.1 hypothetical protein [Microbacterium arborescens]